MTKTIGDANVGDTVIMSGTITGTYKDGRWVKFPSNETYKLNNNQTIYYPSNIEVDNIIPAPWVPQVGDVCKTPTSYELTIHAIVDGVWLISWVSHTGNRMWSTKLPANQESYKLVRRSTDG